MMERPIERIKMLAQWLIEHGVVKNMLSFEKICSMSRCYVRNLMATGAGNPSIEVAANIYEVFPLVNLEWLVTGKGNMWGKRNEDDELVAEIQRRLPQRLKDELLKRPI